MQKLKKIIYSNINKLPGFELEYLDFRDTNYLKKVTNLNSNENIRVFICVIVDGVRLIDNIKLK
jgi:pantothenate synthetase